MSLFNKKGKTAEVKNSFSSIPELPELPKLPDLPYMDESSNGEESLPQLPTFPNNSLGNKFTQNTIKEAIAGKKEEEEVSDAEDFSEEEGEEKGMMPKPLHKYSLEEPEEYETGILKKARSKEITQSFVERNYMTKKAEPIFIRIDKFEESMNIFKDIKTQVSEIESLIRTTKEIKAKEEEELTAWQTEIQGIKDQIEKVNQDIFSRIE
jgi:hypothetical protein